MICNDKEILLNQSDFDCVGEVARHCDLSKLCIAINESEIFDIESLFCDFWSDVVSIWKEINEYQAAYANYVKCLEDEGECVEPLEPENYDLKLNLICGGSFEGCGNKVRNHLGVKRIWVYYAYSRYILINPMNDTPNGMVQKTNDFSIPTPLKEIERNADRYRTMGYDSFKKTLNFLCQNKDVFDYEGECGGCGCGDDDCGRTKAKGYGMKGRIMRKRI